MLLSERKDEAFHNLLADGRICVSGLKSARGNSTKSIRSVRENVSEATLSEESLTSSLMFLLLLKDKTNGANFQHFFSTLKTLLCRGGRVKDGKEKHVWL